MSKNVKNNEERVEKLLAFSKGIINGEDGKKLIDKYRDTIDNMTPYDMLLMEDKQIEMGITPETIKKHIGKIINVFFDSLKKYDWQKPNKNTFLYFLMQENNELEIKLNGIKKDIKQFKDNKEYLQKILLEKFTELLQFEDHYVKKENILFPFLEKNWEHYRAINVMWSLHDDTRKKLKQVIKALQDDNSQLTDLHKLFGEYFFLSFGMIYKENYIVYPVAFETIAEKDWQEMHKQSFEYSFPFVDAPEEVANININEENTKSIKFDEKLKFKTETGELSLDQIQFLLNALPVDITFVDENDEVRYFSRPDERFFPRSPAIIGRKVQNCHPPESVHIIEKILTSFKNNKKDNAKFWIQLKGKFILIQYFALRNDKGEYKGILEVSQDITDIKKLEGEKRLLDWEQNNISGSKLM